MADPNTRQGKRTPVTLKIKFKSETLEQFIERYAVDVSQGGIFIRTKEPLAVGTQMRFEFQLRDASPLIGGEGTVVWTRENDPSRPAIAPGMGVRFDRLAEGSQGVLERILSEKAKQAPQRPPTETTKPPLFTDTPTRVAPAPVQEALLGNESAGGPKRKRPDSFGDQGTPLPRPMPFHSDADEFPEEAFEEATKVRALDELIAQTAEGTGASTSTTTSAVKPAGDDHVRGKRADSTLADPPRADTTAETPHTKATVQQTPLTPADRDSAPGLPSPPEATPKPADAPREARSSVPPATTKLGMEPAKIPLRPSTPSTPPATSPAPQRPVAKDAVTKPTGMRAVAAEPTPVEEPKKSGGAPVFLLVLLFLAAAGAAVWFLVIRPKGDETTTPTKPNNPPGSGGSALATGPGSDQGGSGGSAGMTGPGSAGSATEPMNGSAGSAVAMTGSNGSAGSAGSSAPPPAAELVETMIAAPGIDKATIEVVGTDQKGAAPLKAKLEKGKAYKAHVTAPGYLVADVDVKGGEKTSAKPSPKPRIITVHSTPDGALISVDGATTGHSTPFDLELTKVQAARKSVRIGLRKSGWKPVEKLVDTSKLTEEADKLTGSVDASLDKAPVIVNQNPNNGGGGGGAVKTNGGGNGSAGTTNGSAGTGSGSAGTGAGSANPTGTGGGTEQTGTGTGAGSATPTPEGGTKTPPTGTGTGTGTGSGSSASTPKEPEPDFAK